MEAHFSQTHNSCLRGARIDIYICALYHDAARLAARSFAPQGASPMMDYIFRKLAEKAVDTAVDMAADAIKSKRCAKCGQAMGHDARYCPHCGWDQQVTPPQHAGPPTAPAPARELPPASTAPKPPIAVTPVVANPF